MDTCVWCGNPIELGQQTYRRYEDGGLVALHLHHAELWEEYERGLWDELEEEEDLAYLAEFMDDAEGDSFENDGEDW